MIRGQIGITGETMNNDQEDDDDEIEFYICMMIHPYYGFHKKYIFDRSGRFWRLIDFPDDDSYSQE